MNPYREAPLYTFTDDIVQTIECDVVFEHSMWVYPTPQAPLIINGVTFVAPTMIGAGTRFPKRRG